MSEPPPPVRERRETHEVREVQPGITGALVELGRSLLGGMPPGLLVICLLFGGMLWFLDSQNNQRAAAMEQRTAGVLELLKSCMQHKGE